MAGGVIIVRGGGGGGEGDWGCDRSEGRRWLGV